MKIGKINRLTKAGEMVSVRLPNGKTISAKAGNDLNSTTVLVSKTQSGWFAFSSQGETKTVSTQIINRRPRQATFEIYPIKVLFSIESDNKFEFYIGGDRNVPIKIGELTKINDLDEAGNILFSRTKMISAAINSTGNKPNDWIVMIQYSSPDLVITTPGGQTFTNSNNLEASVILRPNLAPTIHVGANGCDPVGNGFFAPRDPYIWYFFDDQSHLKTGEDYREYSLEFSRSGSTDDLAVNLPRLTVSRPWLYTEDFQGLTTTSLSVLRLYDYVEGAWTFLTLGPQIGTSTSFSYLNTIYDSPSADFNVEASIFISNFFVPSEDADIAFFPLYWDEIEFLSPSETTALLDVFCPNFHNSIMSGGLSIELTNFVSSNYMAEFVGGRGQNQAFDAELLQGLNIVMTAYPIEFGLFFSAKTTSIRHSINIYGCKLIYTEEEALLRSSAFFATALTEYSFIPKSTISTGTFNYTIVSPSGIERLTIPYDLTAIQYRREYDNSKILKEEAISSVTKVSASGNMQMMGVTFDVDIQKTIFAVEARFYSDKYWVYSGHGEAIKQRGLDNSAIIHKIDYEWYADSFGSFTQTVVFTIPPNLLEESFYYKDGFKYPLTTTNQDFRAVTNFYLDMPQRQEINTGPIINYSGFRITPLFNAEDILENDKISRVAWSYDDGEALKQTDIKLDVKTYGIIVDNGTATIPSGSKIKTFKVKNLSPILSQLDPVIADTAKVHSMSCYFN
jgi:hypothetical protein